MNGAPRNASVGLSGESLDQFVAGIFDTQISGNNPYYAPSQSKANQYQPFVSLEQFRNQSFSLIYSVWHLDAPSADLAKGLVDKAMAAETNGLHGNAYFDLDISGGMYPQPDESGSTLRGDWDIYRAAEFAREMGFQVTEDNHENVFGTAPAPLRADNAALYAGTYNYGRYNDAFTWNSGAIGFDFNSSAATNFRSGANWSGGALQRGITVTGGAVDEPFANYIFKFDGIFRNLFEGANVGDAVLRNTPVLEWMMLNIGDPLYRPFSGSTFPRSLLSLAGSGWTVADVNATSGSANIIPNPDGTLIYDSGFPLYNLVVRSFGSTLNGSSDSCTLVYQTVSGDWEVDTRISRVEATGDFAYGGVMFRESTSPSSKYVALFS